MKWLTTELQQDIWNKKYRYKNETLEEFFDRVSGGNLAIRKLIKQGKFLFAGRVLANRGVNDIKSSLSNCYFVGKVEDNIESIFDTAKKLARTFSYGGGCGIDISGLAPKGAKVRNTAKYTSGAVSFMDLYSLVTGLIAQNGRRGALLISMDCSHPDIEDFIDIKTDLNKVTKANISVRISDSFMEAVEQDKDWELSFTRKETNQVIQKTVKAKDLYRKLCKNNHEFAEPGIIFWSNAKTWNMSSGNFDNGGQNPCQHKNAIILTPEGISTIGDIKVGDIIWGKNEWTTVVRKICTGIKPVYRYTTSAGEIECTDNHRIFQNGEAIEVKYAESIDICEPEIEGRIKIIPEVVMDGLVMGDGGKNHTTGKKVLLYIGDNDKDYFDSEIKDLIISCYDKVRKAWIVKTSIQPHELPSTYERTVPDRYFYGNPSVVASFLRGIFSANGSVILNKKKKSDKQTITRIDLKQSSYRLIKQVQIMLGSLGIMSYITTSKANKVKFRNGTYLCKESYTLNISRMDSQQKFFKYIGFIQKYRNEKGYVSNYPYRTSKKSSYDITKVEYLGDFPVYSITVDNETHSYWSGNQLLKNCSEVVFVEKGGCCNLSSINLSEYVDKPFTSEATFNFSLFEDSVKSITTAMNDILDEGMNRHPLPEQIEYAKNWRPIGIGIMGLADMLIKMGLRYGSPESLNFCNEIAKVMLNSAVLQSSFLAEKYGTYPMYDKEKLFKNQFFIKNIDNSVKDIVKEHGLRNSQFLSIAPTGSISTMLGVSGGIEPIFALSYQRKTETLNDTEKYYTVYTPIVKEYMELNNIDNEKDLPDYFITAHDLNYEERINMQATWQRWVDNAISSTINLPKATTVQEIEDIYMLAWKKGLKGLTIYREGCKRAGILTKTKELKRGEIVKAPAISNGKTIKFKSGCGNVYLTITYDNEGNIVQTFIDRGASGGCGSHQQAISRLISLCIRGGINLKDIIDQLNSVAVCPAYRVEKIKNKEISEGSSCPSAIAHILKKFDKVSEQTTNDYEKCPECNEKIIHSEGCVSCHNCGYTRCG